MNTWTLALSDSLIRDSFFNLKYLLRHDATLEKFVLKQVSFIDKDQARIAIERALQIKLERAK